MGLLLTHVVVAQRLELLLTHAVVQTKLGTLLTHVVVGHEQRVVVEPHGWFMWTNDFLGIYDNEVKQNLGVPPQVIPYKPTILGTQKKNY